MLSTLPFVDDILNGYASELGRDFTAYRNHTYRLVNLAFVLSGERQDTLEKLSAAAAYHDLGIWTARTFDYLQPSINLASAYLARSDRVGWTAEITTMILEHHKVQPYRGNPDWLVEPFRRADWIDVTCGVRRFGVPRSTIRPLFAVWPSAGFHRRLAELAIDRLRTQSWNPLPMLRL
jgi:hypothetical protein